MWLFNDRGGREACLIPEATALFQEMANAKMIRGERSFFYAARCYRYERPQAGRYREFVQLGAEIINPEDPTAALARALAAAKSALAAIGLPPESLSWDESASRGLGYYLGGIGFEARAANLGAQSQVLGGGPYREGAGFAIGLDRALLAMGKPVE